MKSIYDDEAFFQAYAQMDRSIGGLEAAGEWHQLQPLFPDVKGKRVLDLGCGYGWHCRYAARMGAAEVLGIDSSQKMIAKAMADTADAAIRFEVCDLEAYAYPERAFDLVISNLVLHYVEDLERVYRQVHRTLEPGGCFLFNIEHPVFTAGLGQDWVYDGGEKPLYWAIDNYYLPGERETNFLGQRVVKQHHTLTQILNGLLRNGFRLEAVEEAVPPESMMEMPGMADELRRPMMLLVKAVKDCARNGYENQGSARPDAGARGKGLGRQLVRYGVERYGVKEVTVNEQGGPYPLLYMKLA